MRSTFLGTLLIACACEPSSDTAPADSAPPETTEPCAFSFAILTDTHLGEGEHDHGSAGWDDEGGDGGPNGEVLSQAVAQVNALAEQRDDLHFVVVLGDLTDSAERSELMAAHDTLAALTLPWFPLLGNHDTWPYTWDETGEVFTEAESPLGDSIFWEVFADTFTQRSAEFPSLVVAEPGLDPEQGQDRPLVNFAFDHCGARLLAFDSNTRVNAGSDDPGIGPEAALNDYDGGTWPWLQRELTSDATAGATRVIALSHHPVVGAGRYTFSEEDFSTIEDFLDQHALGPRIGAFFGGHIHLDTVLEGPAGVPVVLSAATKDGREPMVVSVSAQGEVSWEE
jgi:3',5'-cyclic AMP phosphodiesterase CpdA